MTQNEKLISALIKFQESAHEIRLLWENADSETFNNLIDDYPFSMDFNEQAEKISTWVRTQQNRIESNN
ncbi:hypothetical protein ECC01_06890 [Bacillus tequilensis]|nr:hypothetical protein [Bacillus tequilensis]